MRQFCIYLMGALWALIFVCVSDAQIRRWDTRVVPLESDDAEKRWNEFKAASTVDYCMDFRLEHAPRRGESSYYSGTIYSLNKGHELLTRILIWKSDGDAKAEPSSKPLADFLLKDSPYGCEVWKYANGAAVKLDKPDWRKPMVEGLLYSPFEIISPYKRWEARYFGPGRIGQAVHYFDLRAPADFLKQAGEGVGFDKIRVALSREFNAPVCVEAYGPYNRLLKTLSLGSVKKIDGVWIVSKLELRDDLNRSKDILRFTAAKMKPALPESIFTPQALGKIPEKPLLEEL